MKPFAMYLTLKVNGCESDLDLLKFSRITIYLLHVDGASISFQKDHFLSKTDICNLYYHEVEIMSIAEPFT